MATHDEVAHNWAHQTGKKQNGPRMFYRDGSIYSHGFHFRIARITEDASGRAVCLYTTRNYSLSTSRHKSIVWRSIHNLMPVFRVPSVAGDHAYNHTTLVSDIERILAKAARSRKESIRRHWVIQAAEMAQDLNNYLDAFALDFPRFVLSDDLNSYLTAAREAELEENRHRDAKDREDIRKWLAGEDVHPPHTRMPYVRVKEGVVQTSWGVSVSLRKALALYRLSRICGKRGAGFSPRKVHVVDGWPLRCITADGTLQVGCHIIPLKIQKEAALLAGIVA